MHFRRTDAYQVSVGQIYEAVKAQMLRLEMSILSKVRTFNYSENDDWLLR